jgi:hypothetical protein
MNTCKVTCFLPSWHTRKLLNAIILLMALLIAFTNSVSAANNHLIHWLRITNDTRFSRDFQIVIYPGNQSNGSGSNLAEFTSGWLGAYANTGNTTDFIQVGTIADGSGVRWFAYTEATAYCFRGQSAFGGKGCVGNYNDHVAVGMWSRFELVNYYQGFWIARVWDQNNHPVDIAKLFISQAEVTSVFADSEQAYWTSGLQLNMSFWYYNPQHMKWGTGFQNWPSASDIYHNWFQVLVDPPGTSWCAPYGYQVHPSGNLRFWFMGKNPSPMTCQKLLTF